MTRPLVSFLAAAALAGVSACGAAAGPGAKARSQAASPAAAAGPVYFVQQTGASPARTGGAQGVLALDPQGCFRLGQDGPALVWPSQAALDLTEPGVVRILHGGTRVRVGERVVVSAAPAAPNADGALNRPLGPCAGAVWAVAAFEPGAAAAE